MSLFSRIKDKISPSNNFNDEVFIPESDEASGLKTLAESNPSQDDLRRIIENHFCYSTETITRAYAHPNVPISVFEDGIQYLELDGQTLPFLLAILKRDDLTRTAVSSMANLYAAETEKGIADEVILKQELNTARAALRS